MRDVVVVEHYYSSGLFTLKDSNPQMSSGFITVLHNPPPRQ